MPSGSKRFVRTSAKLLKPLTKRVIPDHLTGDYASNNAHDLFGILPEPTEQEPVEISSTKTTDG